MPCHRQSSLEPGRVQSPGSFLRISSVSSESIWFTSAFLMFPSIRAMCPNSESRCDNSRMELRLFSYVHLQIKQPHWDALHLQSCVLHLSSVIAVYWWDVVLVFQMLLNSLVHRIVVCWTWDLEIAALTPSFVMKQLRARLSVSTQYNLVLVRRKWCHAAWNQLKISVSVCDPECCRHREQLSKALSDWN